MGRFPFSRPAWIPLRVALIAPFALLTLVAVGLVGYLSIRSDERAIDDMARQIQRQIGLRIKEHIQEFLKTPHQLNAANALAMQRGRLDVHSPGDLEEHFRHQVAMFPTVSSVYFGNVQGGLADSGREAVTDARYVLTTEGFVRGTLRKYAVDSEGNPTVLLATVPGFDCRTRPWYTAAAMGGAPVWSAPYVLSTGQDMAIAASRPVHDGKGDLLGVVSVDLFLGHLGTFLGGLEIGETGHGFIIERSGLLVATSSGERPFREGEAGMAPIRIPLEESASPPLRQAARELLHRFGAYGSIREAEALDFEKDEGRQFLQVTPLKDPYGIVWLVGTLIPEADFLARISEEKRNTALLALSALTLVILMGSLAARGITGPLGNLSRSARIMSEGKWSTPLREHVPVVEIAELSRSFNRMSVQLRQTLESLSSELLERKRTEEALRESENRLDLVLKGADLCSWDLSMPEGRVVFNRRWAEMLGYPEEDLDPTLTAWERLVHPEDLPRVLKDLHALLEGTASSYEAEYRLRARGGRWIWILAKGKVFRKDAQGRALRAAGTHQDITVRKEMELRLRLFMQILETTSEAVAVSDPEGRLVYVNPAHQKLFGRTFEEALQCTFRDYYPPESLAYRKRVVFPALARGQAWQGEMEACDVNGRRFPLWERVDTLRDEEGRLLYAFGIMHDNSGQKRAEAERLDMERRLLLTQKHESLGTMAGAVAHHFNNLLTAVLGNLELARHGLPPSHKVLPRLERAAQAAGRAAELSTLMLTCVGQGVGEKLRCALSSEILHTLPLMEASLPPHADLHTDLPAGLPDIEADTASLFQLLVSLLSNAAEALEGKQGTVTVRTGAALFGEEELRSGVGMEAPRAGPYVFLEVTDSGCGMDMDTVHRIFDPFFSTKFTGRGLGLATTLGIVRSHGGAILVRTAPDKGTTIRVLFPALEAPALSGADTHQTPSRSQTSPGPRTILLADDEESVRTMAREMLEILGFKVLVARDGTEALEVFERYAPEIGCVLCDLDMPGRDGYGVLSAVRKLRPEVPVILASGYDEPSSFHGGPREEPQAFLRKPYSMNELQNLLESFL